MLKIGRDIVFLQGRITIFCNIYNKLYKRYQDILQKSLIMEELQMKITEKGLPPLINREFVKISELGDKEQTVRIMQWNLLAQALTKGEENFIACPKEALKWETRKLRLLEEILRYRPTVLCLEEVDMYEWMTEQLFGYGYRGIFYGKPDSPCLYIRGNQGPDGCAVFYDSSKLTLQKSDSVILKFEDGDMSNQVSVMCRFQTKSEEPKDFFVAATHLKAKPGFEDSRKEQSKYLTKYIYDNYKEYPIVVCGDFNGEANEPLYEIMTSSHLDLTSAYTSLSADGKEPKYTTWKIRSKGEVCHTIDYVWYTKKGLKLISLLDIPSDNEIGEKKLPSFRYPSDHISLVCDFVVE